MTFDLNFIINYFVFILCWMGVGIIAGIWLLFRQAPYGRYSTTKWGPMMSNRLAWMLMELAVMVVFALWVPWRDFNWHTPATVMMGLFFIHYIHRALVYPFMIRTQGKKMPVVIMLSAVLFNTVNGSLLGIYFGHFAWYDNNWYTSPFFIIGTLLFVTGMIINWTSDYQLIHLRGKGETGYKIPPAGLFRLISSPNLFGEIMEWGGFALLSCSWPALAFFVWTCANLVPRALANHRWYKKQFADYPAERKRLIPYVW